MAKGLKVARVVIDLPDGTHVEAEGPGAEELARRALSPQAVGVPYWHSPWYYQQAPVVTYPVWTSNNLSGDSLSFSVLSS